jgi:hypothetical protein
MIETILCLIFGGGILLTGFWGLWNDYKSKKFPTVEALFSNAIILKDEGHYKVELIYKYRIDETIYTFQQTAKDSIGNVSITFLSSAEEKVKSYVEKKESIKLYYNPNNPKKARTEIGFEPVTIAVMVLGLAFFLLGLRFLIYD